jgi:hypothetical protein
MADYAFADVLQIYHGSNGEVTKALYARLESVGVDGVVAVNLFRACKASQRAKVYRGGVRGRGSYRSMAYDRKQWAMDNLCSTLEREADDLSIKWGWGLDKAAVGYEHVLYVEIPTGQVSFHTNNRGKGPNHSGEWDGIRNASPERICRWIAGLLAADIRLEAVREQLEQRG